MDTIFIDDFRLEILVGIYEWEKRIPQAVRFDLEIGIPTGRTPHSNVIDDTIDYARVVSRLEQSLQANHFLLLEALAEHVAQVITEEFRSPWVKVRLAKLAPLRNVKSLGVTIERGKRS